MFVFHSNFILDLCTSDQIDEVEIFSLLEEQLPRYKLRADSLTKFGGYQNNVSCQRLGVEISGKFKEKHFLF